MVKAILRWILPGLLAAVLLYFSLRGVAWSRVWAAIAGARRESRVGAGQSTAIATRAAADALTRRLRG